MYTQSLTHYYTLMHFIEGYYSWSKTQILVEVYYFNLKEFFLLKCEIF